MSQAQNVQELEDKRCKKNKRDIKEEAKGEAY